MKASSYIYITPLDDQQHLIFSGITRDFIVIPNKLLDSYETILNAPDKYQHSHPSIVSKLQEIGLIIDDNFDEREFIRKARNSFITKNEYKTIILPTFECNYNCWYCKQNHRPVKIDPQKLSLIIKHVKTYLLENDIESYVLAWFGGEPLTQPAIIKQMTTELYEFCEQHGIKFSGGVTTNGALLTEETIKMLKDCHITVFQITIDGNATMHDKTKYDSSNPSAYHLLMNNLNNLLTNHPEAKLNLRFNYTPLTIKNNAVVTEVCNAIPQKFRDRIKIDLQKVWQIDEGQIDIEKLKRIQKGFTDAGFTLTTDSIFSPCYVDKQHYNAIYYTAEVEKCDQIDMEHLRGFIDETGHIQWKEKPLIEDYDIFAEDSECATCAYVPICLNGCPSQREKLIKRHGKIVCAHDNDYNIFEHRILDYCWRVIHNQSLKNNNIRHD